MNCKRARSRLTAFLDCEIAEPERLNILSHLESCADCRRELELLTRLSDELSCLVRPEVPPYFTQRLKQRIADRPGRSFVRHLVWLRRAAIPAGVLAGVAVAALLGSLLGRTIYGWRAVADSSSALHTGSVLLDDSPVGPLNQVYDQFYTGGGGG